MSATIANAPAASVRRAFVDGHFGQIHLRKAGPVDPGTQRPPLLCFHQSPNAGSNFTRFLGEMGRDRLAVAPDTPGFGESDAPAAPPEIADYADAMGDVIDALGLDGPVDLLGYHTGVLIAAELALLRPDQVRRLILIGIPVFSAEERAAFEKRRGRFRSKRMAPAWSRNGTAFFIGAALGSNWPRSVAFLAKNNVRANARGGAPARSFATTRVLCCPA
ncbi:MAG: alpha/beta fold hydrolase [Alphaproteobacteria bacterium]